MSKELGIELDRNRIDLEVESDLCQRTLLDEKDRLGFETASKRWPRQNTAKTSSSATNLGSRVTTPTQTRRLEFQLSRRRGRLDGYVGSVMRVRGRHRRRFGFMC